MILGKGDFFMKLIDITNKIDKSKENEDWVDITNFSSELGYEFDCVGQSRLKSYWVGNWCCTDTLVGYRIYFLDDEPVCFSIQPGRKDYENFKWFSEELAAKVREYLISIMAEQKDTLSIETCDINEDIGDSFKIDFNSNVIHWDKAMLNGEPVKFIERIRQVPDWGIDEEVRIELSNGEQKIVNIHDLDFKFNLL